MENSVVLSGVVRQPKIHKTKTKENYLMFTLEVSADTGSFPVKCYMRLKRLEQLEKAERFVAVCSEQDVEVKIIGSLACAFVKNELYYSVKINKISLNNKKAERCS
ncbi:MAG: hypothetical protein KatS3mg087_1909 [Patescibacteria group bacterium]|nr:MAG: hypothetical protein KatS3mg087_1909 [Patescibacteria group bacterium]